MNNTTNGYKNGFIEACESCVLPGSKVKAFGIFLLSPAYTENNLEFFPIV